MRYLTLLLLLFILVSYAQSKQGKLAHGVCANSFLEKRTSKLERQLRKEWFIRCMTTYIIDKSEYLDNDVISPRCNLAGIGDMCPVIKTVFRETQFTLLGPNIGIHQARFIHTTYAFDDKEYAVFHMKYELSWLKNEEGGPPILLDINEHDKKLYNGAFAILYMDPGEHYALLGACPHFNVSFLMMDKITASKVKSNDDLSDIFDKLSETWNENNMANVSYHCLFGDVPAAYTDMTPPYNKKYNWKY